jgi:hypothetical protein
VYSAYRLPGYFSERTRVGARTGIGTLALNWNRVVKSVFVSFWLRARRLTAPYRLDGTPMALAGAM